MLAAIFIQGGIAALKSPQGHVQAAKLDAVTPVLEKATDAAAPTVDKTADAALVDLPHDYRLAGRRDLVKIDGGVKVVAGTMLALGKFPRLASTALAASLVPTMLAGHRFWEETDPEAKQMQQIQFFKNVGLLGGLLVAAADTEGKPSLAWRGRKAAKLAAAAAATQAAAVSDTVDEVSGKVSEVVHDLSGKVSEATDEVSGRLTGAAHDASGTVAGLAVRRAAPGRRGQLAGVGAGRVVEEGLARLEARVGEGRRRVGRPVQRAARASKRASARASDLSGDLAASASTLAGELSAAAAKAAERAEERGAELQKTAEKRAIPA